MAKGGFVNRLQCAIGSWQKINESALANRQKMLSYYASGFYGQQKSKGQHVMKLVQRGIDIIVPYLAMTNPKTMFVPRFPKLRPFAITSELAMNHLLEEIEFVKYSLRPGILNSMFGMGIWKTGIMKAEEVEIFGYLHDVGQIYCDLIDDCDYIGDPSAKNREQFEFEGHRYRLPVDVAKEFFGSKHADSIKADFTLHGSDSPESISKGEERNFSTNSLYQWSEFIDIWLPREDVIITIKPEGKGSRVLRTVEYDGPEGGPFDVLGYKYFPETATPIPPVWGWLPYDTMCNVLLNKMRNQAEREKKILLYEKSVEKDAKNILEGPDGGAFGVANVEAFKEVEFGGASQQNYQYVNYLESQFSIQGGNLYTIGGRNSEAGTLGQEQMMQANASRIIEDMVNEVYRVTTSILKKMAWHLWTDPLIQIPVVKRIPGVTDLSVIFSDEAKEGDFYDFNFQLVPYSMQRMSPTQRHQTLMSFLNGWVIPVMPMAAQQGVQVNLDAITKELGRLLDINVDDFWESGVPSNAVGLGPYQPMQGTVMPKQSSQGDDRFGADLASRESNLMQYESSERAGNPSPPNNSNQK